MSGKVDREQAEWVGYVTATLATIHRDMEYIRSRQEKEAERLRLVELKGAAWGIIAGVGASIITGIIVRFIMLAAV